MKKILVVDDEKPISDIVKFNLTKEGYEVYTAYDGQEALDKVELLLKEYKPDLVVLGYPLLENGDAGPRAQISEEFRDILEKESGIKVVLQDERCTTKDSEEFLIQANVSRKKRKKIIDQQAAIRILQYYLDSNKK